MEWVCRERCYWKDVTWAPGEIYNLDDQVAQGVKWELGRGWWAPAGLMLIDPHDERLIPWYFEPKDMSALTNARQVYLARDHKLNPRAWQFTWEAAPEEEVDYSTLADPQPLDTKDFVKLKEDPEALMVNKPKRSRVRKRKAA